MCAVQYSDCRLPVRHTSPLTYDDGLSQFPSRVCFPPRFKRRTGGLVFPHFFFHTLIYYFIPEMWHDCDVMGSVLDVCDSHSNSATEEKIIYRLSDHSPFAKRWQTNERNTCQVEPPYSSESVLNCRSHTSMREPVRKHHRYMWRNIYKQIFGLIKEKRERPSRNIIYGQ